VILREPNNHQRRIARCCAEASIEKYHRLKRMSAKWLHVCVSIIDNQ